MPSAALQQHAAAKPAFIRAATPADIQAVGDLGLEAMELNPYEGLVVSERRIRDTARSAITSPSDFCMVCEQDGQVVGAVTAVVHEMTFYERKQASVVQFYCKAPGQGIRLIRELLRWVDGRRAIRAVVFTLEHDMDPRIAKMLRRLGFLAELPVYMKVL